MPVRLLQGWPQRWAAPCLRHDSFEADDLIGSALVALRGHGPRRDRPRPTGTGQMLGAHDEQWDFARDQLGRRRREAAPRRASAPGWRTTSRSLATRSTISPACLASAPRPQPPCCRTSAPQNMLYARLDERSPSCASGAAAGSRQAEDACAELARLSRALPPAIAVDAPVPQEPAAWRRGVDQEVVEALFDRLRLVCSRGHGCASWRPRRIQARPRRGAVSGYFFARRLPSRPGVERRNGIHSRRADTGWSQA